MLVSGPAGSRGLFVLAALVFGASCDLDTSVPAFSGCPDCGVPAPCEADVCGAEDASAEVDASTDSAVPPSDPASSDSGDMPARCETGATESCFDGPPDAGRQPPCASGTRTCSSAGTWGECLGQVLPSRERCNELDEDCDGSSDEDFDLQSDQAHCGACGNACAADRECCAGGCIDVRTDRDHCGACGAACSGDQQCCRGRCVDAQSDRDNCGASCMKCAEGNACCEGACADLGSFQHCGECGNACDPDGELCCGGECTRNASACNP